MRGTSAGLVLRQFDDLDPDALRSFARDVWRGVNLLNLREFIRPTMSRAHIVVEKRADHTVGRVDVTNLVP